MEAWRIASGGHVLAQARKNFVYSIAHPEFFSSRGNMGIERFYAAGRLLCGVSAGLLPIAGASAQTEGAWLVKGGVSRVMPHVSGGDVRGGPPGSRVDIKAATSEMLTLGYMLTDEISLEFIGGIPYKHDIVGAGSLSPYGKLGSVKQAGPTLFVQYRFLRSDAPVRPYVGLGATYAYFYGSKGSNTLNALTMTNPGGPSTQVSVCSAWGPTLQIGATLKLDSHWFLEAQAAKTYIKNTATLSTGQQVKLRLDPLAASFSIGYRF
jgi:outer membrane protein